MFGQRTPKDDPVLVELEHVCTGLRDLVEAITLLRYRLERVDGRLEGLETWLSARTDYQRSPVLERAGRPRPEGVP